MNVRRTISITFSVVTGLTIIAIVGAGIWILVLGCPQSSDRVLKHSHLKPLILELFESTNDFRKAEIEYLLGEQLLAEAPLGASKEQVATHLHRHFDDFKPIRWDKDWFNDKKYHLRLTAFSKSSCVGGTRLEIVYTLTDGKLSSATASLSSTYL